MFSFSLPSAAGGLSLWALVPAARMWGGGRQRGQEIPSKETGLIFRNVASSCPYPSDHGALGGVVGILRYFLPWKHSEWSTEGFFLVLVLPGHPEKIMWLHFFEPQFPHVHHLSLWEPSHLTKAKVLCQPKSMIHMEGIPVIFILTQNIYPGPPAFKTPVRRICSNT